MDGHQQKESIPYFSFSSLKKNENWTTENVSSVYGIDIVGVNHLQFWFRRSRSGNFDVKVAPRSGRSIIKNIDKVMEIIESKHLITVVVTKELIIAQKTV